jgi:hypothetical protein
MQLKYCWTVLLMEGFHCSTSVLLKSSPEKNLLAAELTVGTLLLPVLAVILMNLQKVKQTHVENAPITRTIYVSKVYWKIAPPHGLTPQYSSLWGGGGDDG